MSEDLLTKEFKPNFLMLGEEEGLPISSIALEDTAYYTKPVYPGKYNTVDWMMAMDDHRVIGIQVYSHPLKITGDKG